MHPRYSVPTPSAGSAMKPQESPHSGQELAAIYAHRFSPEELASKRVLWATLYDSFFTRHVSPEGTLLDLGAGYCEFINVARAQRRLAVDLNPETVEYAAPGVEVVTCSSDDMSVIQTDTVDTVFTSNFFEHLPNKQVLAATLTECRRVLKPGGRLVVLMPNLRYLPGRYWDYFDHHLPLTHLSLSE